MKIYLPLLLAILPGIRSLVLGQSLQWSHAITSNASDHNYGLATSTTPFGDAVFNAGAFLGTAHFDTPGGTATVTSPDFFSFYVTKHTIAGDPEWVATFLGGSMYQAALATDAGGNCYVHGSFFGSFDADPGPGVYTISADGPNIGRFLIKLDPNGNFVWGQHFATNKRNNDDLAICVKGDAIYCSGHFAGTCDFDSGPGVHELTAQDTCDIVVVKLSTEGQFQWAFRTGSPDNTEEQQEWGSSIAVDAGNNVYLAGVLTKAGDLDPGPGVTLLTPQAERDVFLLKLSPAGIFQWAVQGGDAMIPGTVSVACGANNSLYLTGPVSDSSAADADIFVRRYTNQGALLWSHRFGGSQDDIGKDIDADENGNVYVTGSFRSPEIDFDPGTAEQLALNSFGLPNSYLLKLTANGDLAWVAALDAAPYDLMTALDYHAGVLYTNGYFGNGPLDTDFGSAIAEVPFAGITNTFFAKYDTLAIGSVGLDEPTEVPFLLYPNPAFSTVQLNVPLAGSTFTLFNLQGERLLEQRIETLSTEIGLGDLPAGTYLVEVTHNGRRSTQRLVKQ